MTPSAGSMPVATFVIEREPIRGYRVTQSTGPKADERGGQALNLLDEIGQPNPTGPTTSCHLINPEKAIGEFVAVTVRRLDNGEAWYCQAWFERTGVPSSRPSGGLRLLARRIFVGALLIVAGALLFVTAWVIRGVRDDAGNPAPGAPSNVAPSRVAASPLVSSPTPHEPQPPWIAKVGIAAGRSPAVRKKLRDYLSQEGLAAREESPTRRSVKLIADLEGSPPAQESVKLDNREVERLLDVLEALDEIDGAAGPANNEAP